MKTKEVADICGVTEELVKKIHSQIQREEWKEEDELLENEDKLKERMGIFGQVSIEDIAKEIAYNFDEVKSLPEYKELINLINVSLLDCDINEYFINFDLARSKYIREHFQSLLKKYTKKWTSISNFEKSTKGEEKEKHSFVYIATCKSTPGLYKIGKSNNLKTRESTLKCGNLYLTLEYSSILSTEEAAYKFEKYLHKVFSNKRVDREWFQLSNEDLDLLTSLFSFRKSIESNL